MNNQYLIPIWRTAPLRATRDGIGDGLVKLGENQDDVVVVSADLAESVRVREFADLYPDRFFEVGVAEQNMAGIAAGLSVRGLVPFMVSFATFSPGRNWEQIRISISLSNMNVKIVGSHAGVATGKNGPSQQGTEDIALMRVLPNMVVLVPADAKQAELMIESAYRHTGPVYIRTTRPDTPNFTSHDNFEIGKAYVYRTGKDLTICACGIQVWDSLIVADELAQQGIECEVINVSTIKPLDHYTIMESAKKTGRVMTIEDHQIMGGMGSAISEMLSEEYPVPIKRIGIDDRFGLSGEWGDVYKEVGLDRVSLKKNVIDWVNL